MNCMTRALTTICEFVLRALRGFGLCRGPITEEDVRQLIDEGVRPTDSRAAAAAELSVRATREPVLEILTREEHEQLMDISSGTGDTGVAYGAFDEDLRIQTGRVLNPLAGYGHMVYLDLELSGRWVIRRVESWRA